MLFTADRLNNFYVRVGDVADVSQHNKVCGYRDVQVPDKGHITITCPGGTIGRYVSVQLTDATLASGVVFAGILTLCEVVVEGYSFQGTLLLSVM